MWTENELVEEQEIFKRVQELNDQQSSNHSYFSVDQEITNEELFDLYLDFYSDEK